MMVENRAVIQDLLHVLCIEQNWYTLGNNEEYKDFLDYAGKIKNATTQDIVSLAENILAHSEKDFYSLRNVCFFIARDSIRSMFIEEEKDLNN